MFSFSYVATRALLTVVQQGYWSIEEFRDYERQFYTHHRMIMQARSSYRVISDCREYPVQSPEVSDAFEALFQVLMAENKGRYAIVAASALNKIQARRVIPHRHVEIFSKDEWDKAMQWLFDEDSLPDP